jgi:hypothetical protein
LALENIKKPLITNSQGSNPPSSPSSPAATAVPPEGSKPPADEVEQRRKKLLKEINRIDNWTNVAADNGLFDKQKKVAAGTFEDIQNKLKEARKYLYSDDLSDADYYASLALRAYDGALYSSSRVWRFSNMYAGHIWIYLIAFLAAVLAFYWYQLDSDFLNLHVRIQEAALHAATWGAVGGILRGLWYLKDKVSDRRYRNSLRIYFLSVPFLGGLFGAVLYFVLISGLFIIAPAQAPNLLNQNGTASVAANQSNASTTTGTINQAANQSNANNTTGSVSTVAIIPLAILAGFNWEWIITILKRIGDSFKGETEPDDKIEK